MRALLTLNLIYGRSTGQIMLTKYFKFLVRKKTLSVSSPCLLVSRNIASSTISLQEFKDVKPHYILPLKFLDVPFKVIKAKPHKYLFAKEKRKI
jgi:hypothetical protein